MQNFIDLLLGVWNQGLLGVSISQIIISLIILTVAFILRGVISNIVIKWLENLNKAFGNLLAKERLIKTGGYDKISKHQNTKARKETVHRNTTTVETLNYGTQEGTVR